MLGAHVVHAVAFPFVGKIADIVGRKIPYGIGIALTATWGFFAYPMFDSGEDMMILAAVIVGLLFHALMYAGQPAIMAEMSPEAATRLTMAMARRPETLRAPA